MTVVDASVALKWVLEEEGSDRARQIAQDGGMCAPSLLWVECANTLWTVARRKQISFEAAAACLSALKSAPILECSSRAYAGKALSLAAELDQTAYDCLYLAVAIDRNEEFVSADIRFCNAVSAHPAFGRLVRVL